MSVIELLVYDEDGDELVSAAQVVAEGLAFYEEGAALGLASDQGAKLGEDFNLGRVDLLAPQLAEAARRLAGEKDALIRAADLDEPEVPYLRFECAGDKVWVSAFLVDDREMRRVWPIPAEVWQGGRSASGPAGTPEDLHRWVGDKGAALYDRAVAARMVKAHDLRWSASRQEVVDGLRAAAELAMTLAARAGREARWRASTSRGAQTPSLTASGRGGRSFSPHFSPDFGCNLRMGRATILARDRGDRQQSTE